MARTEAPLSASILQQDRRNTTRCSACGNANDSAALFCARCTAPLAVVALGNLTESDRRSCLAALLQVLADASAQPLPPTPGVHDEALWRAYLSAFWLRPETALILYAEALAIRGLADLVGHPWLDLGCGDGIHAGLYSGWRFDSTFDAFQSLDTTAADIYHHWNPADFTASVTARGPALANGIDIKDTAVARATAMNVFTAVHRSDAARLPLADGSVRTIFSNMLRDLGDPLPGALDECRRVLTDDGVLLISAMTPLYARHLHFAPAARDADAAGDTRRARDLLRLDRGRSVFCRQQLGVDAWKSLLAEHGLKITGVKPIVGPAIIRFWDIGLRPFSIALLKQRQSWRDAGVLAAIKPGVVDFLAGALDPLVRKLTAGEACMNLLAVSKA